MSSVHVAKRTFLTGSDPAVSGVQDQPHPPGMDSCCGARVDPALHRKSSPQDSGDPHRVPAKNLSDSEGTSRLQDLCMPISSARHRRLNCSSPRPSPARTASESLSGRPMGDHPHPGERALARWSAP
jgi:hypothetical protein